MNFNRLHSLHHNSPWINFFNENEAWKYEKSPLFWVGSLITANFASTWWRRGESISLWLITFATHSATLRCADIGTRKCALLKKQFAELFFISQTFRSSILSSFYKHKKTHHEGVFFCVVETRRIELLSENTAGSGSPSAACDRDSSHCQLTSRLTASVASLIPGRRKA